ncbi:MAG TPA: DUF3094 family protein [Cellvibrionaceae bacterium]
MTNKLSSEDQARVDRVVSVGVNSVERKPFRVWLLLLVIVAVLTLMSGISYLIALNVGVV